MVLFPLVKSPKDDTHVSKMEVTNKAYPKKRNQPQYYKVPEKQYELFDFDPNTADSTQLNYCASDCSRGRCVISINTEQQVDDIISLLTSPDYMDSLSSNTSAWSLISR